MKFTAQELQALRQEAGYSKQALSERLVLNLETIDNIENGSLTELPNKLVKAWWISCRKESARRQRQDLLVQLKSLVPSL